MKNGKYAGMMVLAMAAIIAAQIVLSGIFGWHAAEAFSKTAMNALFFYSILRISCKKRQVF